MSIPQILVLSHKLYSPSYSRRNLIYESWLAKNMMVLQHLLGRFEFMSKFRTPLLMQSTFTVSVLVTGYSSLQFRQLHQWRRKWCFWNHDKHLEVILLFPKKTEVLKGIKGVLGYPELKIEKPSHNRWLLHELCVTAICKELPPFAANPFTVIRVIWRSEPYGMYPFLTSINGVSCSYHKSLVLLLF